MFRQLCILLLLLASISSWAGSAGGKGVPRPGLRARWYQWYRGLDRLQVGQNYNAYRQSGLMRSRAQNPGYDVVFKLLSDRVPSFLSQSVRDMDLLYRRGFKRDSKPWEKYRDFLQNKETILRRDLPRVQKQFRMLREGLLKSIEGTAAEFSSRPPPKSASERREAQYLIQHALHGLWTIVESDLYLRVEWEITDSIYTDPALKGRVREVLAHLSAIESYDPIRQDVKAPLRDLWVMPEI